MEHQKIKQNCLERLPGTVPGNRKSRSRIYPKVFNNCFGLLAFLALIIGSSGTLKAQTPNFFKTGTTTTGNTTPLNTTSQKTQLLFTPSDFSTTPTAGAISKLYFRNSAAGASVTFTNFQVSFLQNSLTAFANTTYLTGLTVAHSAATQTVTANAVAGGWFEIPLSAPYFQYDPTQTLIVEIQYSAKTGGISTTTTTSTGNKRLAGTSLTATTGTASTTWNDFGMDLLTACTAPPTPGTTVASVALLCPGENFNLSLTGTSFGVNQTYQWETSPNGTTGWTAIGTASGNPYFTTSQTSGTHYYRAAVTCSGQTENSVPVAVTSPALSMGNYTIDNNAPASATNFQSFTAAINSLSCGSGITGPVTFTVNAASGPYNEQIEIGAIQGASATNTITFQGNGRTLRADPVSATRAAIKLNGAKYVTINNLNIETLSSATYGWGIHFINGADNNTISNNTITIGTTNTTESNSVGIVFVNSSTSVTTTGGNNGNNNVISGNTIIGGWKGIHMHSADANPGNNQITNNTIRDFYSEGIEVNAANATLIEGNNISRANKTAVTTFYGIYLTGNLKNSVINKNRIHNTHDAATDLTGSVYGIYFTSNDAPVGSENIVKNNLIYNINNSTGNINALFNSSSDGVYYYNNSINLDNAGSIGIARGLYQTLATTNLKLINNNIVVNTGGPAANLQAIFLNTATTTLESNYNNLYVPNGNIGNYSATDYPTLTAWRGANTTTPYDLNSLSVDPAYVNGSAGNLAPSNSLLNNVAQPLAAVTHDFTGATRSATPDIGAYEFTPATDDAGVSAILSPVSSTCGASNQETVTITVQNTGLVAISNIPVTYQINGGPFVTNEIVAGPIAPGATANYSFVTKADLSAGGNFTITAKTMLPGDALAANDASSVTINILNPVSTFPYLEDFETFTVATNATGYMNGWEVTPTATTSLYRWNIDISTTPTSSTGPTVDHTFGTATGKYVFTESTSGSAGAIAELVSPCISLPTTNLLGLEFWYHMYGATTGTLHVDVYNGTAWVNDVFTISGQQQTATADPWRKAFVSLAGYSGSVIKVRFRGERGGGGTGDMAIDDVKFYPLPPVELQVTNVTLPSGSCGLTSTETVCISIKNNGGTTISGFPVSYTVNGGTAVTETVAGPLAPNATLNYYFTTKANFSTIGTFTVIGTVNATGDADATNDSATGTIISKPTIATFPYTEDFESGAGNWSSGGTNSSWALGTPAGTIINSAASGTKAWVTNLTGNHPNNENSAVVGPCFNFTSIPNPMISMKIFWEIEDDWDGAVLQSSIDNGATWQMVGNFGDPNNWYNSDSIDANPGNQPLSLNGAFVGWSGTGTAGSGGWVTASHALNGLGGLPSVQLRIAFGSDAAVVKEGFAFDDISISNMVAVPTVTAGGPTTFCQGGSVLLTAASTTPGVTYTWELNGTPIAGATGNTYTATASGNYTAVANLGGSATSTPIAVTVDPTPATPTITAAGSTTICTGGSVALTAASTTSGATYQWLLDGTAIAGATSATYTASAAGNYTAVATAGGCPSAASTATAVTVNTPAATPTITATGPTTFCDGDSVILTAASTTAGATYEWFRNGTAISGATTATIAAFTAGNYTAVATAGGCSSAASAATVVTVNPIPATPTITQDGGTLTSSAATGNQWFLNGTLIPAATGQILITTANGNYTVVTIGANGCPSDTSATTNVTNTGLGNPMAGMSVQVYPNPATGSFNLKLNGYRKDATVVLYSLTGQQLLAEKVSADGNAKAISVKGFAAGTYLLKVTSDKGVQVTRLIVE